MRRSLAALGLVATAFAGQAQAPEDPVLKARAQRAAAAGVPEADLPPVPRSIIEPPPLPPPELHPRDMKGSRAVRASKRGARKGKAAKAKGARKQKAPAKRRR